MLQLILTETFLKGKPYEVISGCGISKVGPHCAVSIHSIVIHKEAACPGFLGERVLRAKLDFSLNEESTQGRSRESWATLSLWSCRWSAIHMSQILQSHWDSEKSSLWPGGELLQHKSVQGSHYEYLILFLLLWVTGTPHKELIFWACCRPDYICTALLSFLHRLSCSSNWPGIFEKDIFFTKTTFLRKGFSIRFIPYKFGSLELAQQVKKRNTDISSVMIFL